MGVRMRVIRAIVVGLVLAVGLAAPGVAQQSPTVVYLVRHAEKQDDGTRDPALTDQGAERASLLSHMLRDAGITHIHSTEFKRTQLTAAPLAQVTGLEVGSYDPRDLPAFASWLKANPGRHLVSGHSNTTPGLVKALGGEPGDPIEEAHEYDRLYIVTIAPDETVATILLRYGPSS
jgi:2,3-bisphosphoglycerate-dependent phosphoglycerate mutase